MRFSKPSDLLRAAFGQVGLSVLLFGPSAKRLSENDDERLLQQKRLDISAALTAAGHTVRLAEELVELGFITNLPYSVIMREYDIVISYISLHTAVTEVEIIQFDGEVARKSIIFLDSRETSGVVLGVCAEAEKSGAMKSLFDFPNDIISCNLLGMSLAHVENAQSNKYAI